MVILSFVLGIDPALSGVGVAVKNDDRRKIPEKRAGVSNAV